MADGNNLPEQQFTPTITRPKFEFKYVTVAAKPSGSNKKQVIELLQKDWEIISATSNPENVHYIFARAKRNE
jgi:hypothetical protein